MSKGGEVEQFLREKPVHRRLRRLVDRINLTDAGQASLGGPGSYLVVCALCGMWPSKLCGAQCVTLLP